ncbi:hypothetical protein P7C73_g5306, partial [Tremellales sp. Uapishka_1]
PLPPKIPKNSPKAASRSPMSKPSLLAPPTSRTLSAMHSSDPPEETTVDSYEPDQLEAEVQPKVEVDIIPVPADLNLPPMSATSLTPPPTSEDADQPMDVDVDMDVNWREEEDAAPQYNQDRIEHRVPTPVPEVEPQEAEEWQGEEGDDWDSYRHRRAVRGFSAAKATVKIEDEEDTPRRNGSSRAKVSGGTTPSGSEPGRRGGRKRRGEGQLLMDDQLLPKEMKNGGVPVKKREREKEVEIEVGSLEDEVEEDGKDVTRCVCLTSDVDVLMIQCDKCFVWQHGPCTGIYDDDEAPDGESRRLARRAIPDDDPIEYFCEQCKPELHLALKRWMKSRGRAPVFFVAPTAADLQHFFQYTDKHPPSQSKRWENTAYSVPVPNSRSHHRKAASPENDGRRSTRGRLPTEKAEGREFGKRRSAAPSTHRKASIGNAAGPSVSPNRSSHTPPPKKRSTMNSRDSAYEEQVKAALEASKREMLGEVLDEIEEEKKEKRRREDEEVREEKRKGKKRKEEDDGGVDGHPGGPGKPKHPNQYTYRPKPPSTSNANGPLPAPSPAKRVAASTPTPSVPPPAPHEHGTRRALTNGAQPIVYTATSVSNLNWYLPDHLSPFSDLLPAPKPKALRVPSSRPLPSLPRNHFSHQRYGPFSEEVDENGNLVLPGEPVLRDTNSERKSHLEPPSRVKYPVKRITTAEIKKRVRNVLEYVGRVQSEESKRSERGKLLGIDLVELPELQEEEEDDNEDEENEAEDVAEGDVAKAVRDGPPLTASELMDELTRDLIAFQESFHGQLALNSPLPPSVATFGNTNGSLLAPNTPTMEELGVERL